MKNEFYTELTGWKGLFAICIVLLHVEVPSHSTIFAFSILLLTTIVAIIFAAFCKFLILKTAKFYALVKQRFA